MLEGEAAVRETQPTATSAPVGLTTSVKKLKTPPLPAAPDPAAVSKRARATTRFRSGRRRGWRQPRTVGLRRSLTASSRFVAGEDDDGAVALALPRAG